MSKVVVITGGTRGIGRAIVEELVSEDYLVVFGGRDSKEGLEIQTRTNGKAVFIQSDVTVKEDIDRLFDETIGMYGSVDAFINNAGITVRASIADTTEEDFDKLIKVNLKGFFLCLKRVIPIMSSQRNGRILVISSINAIRPLPSQGIYSAIKGALEVMVKCLSVDLGPYGITVNSIAPGAIDTDMNRPFWTDESIKRLNEIIPLKRIGTPEDVAKIAKFLLSDDASYITGATIIVDGGLVNIR